MSKIAYINLSFNYKDKELELQILSDQLTYIENTEELKELKKKFNEPITDYSLELKDNLYFLPGTNVPRSKLKETHSNLNIKSTRDITTATKIISGRNSMDAMFEHTYGRFIKVSFFQKLITIFQELDYDIYNLTEVNDLLEDYENDYIRVNYFNFLNQNAFEKDFIKKYPQELFDKIRDIATSKSSKWYYKLKTNKFSEEDLEDFLKADIYSDKTILAGINGDDSVEIDEEVFDNLKKMLSSSDEDNHTVAAEIMANCNYEDSAGYLLCLLRNYDYALGGCKGSKHVNYRSFLSYFDHNHRYGLSTLDLYNKLETTGNFNLKHVKIIFEAYIHELTYSSNRYALVSEIRLSKDAADKIGYDLIYDTESETTKVIAHEQQPA